MTARQLALIRQEVKRLQEYLGATDSKVRAVTAVTRHLLLCGAYIYNGRWCNPKTKSLGAGVYEIWLEAE